MSCSYECTWKNIILKKSNCFLEQAQTRFAQAVPTRRANSLKKGNWCKDVCPCWQRVELKLWVDLDPEKGEQVLKNLGETIGH
jgi:hypothetical protein